MRTIYLHGVLGDSFGKEWRLEVKSPAEAFRAIECARPGFLQYFKENEKSPYHVIVGDKNSLCAMELLQPFVEEESFHVYPAVAGSGSDGLFQVIIGALIFVAAVFVTGGTAAFGSFGAFGSASTAILSGANGFAAMAFASFGLAMVFGGISTMLMSQSNKTETKEEQKGSYLFNGAVNTTRQGGPIPLGYGEMIIGSQVISLTVRNVRIDVAVPPDIIEQAGAAIPWLRRS